MKQKLFVVLIVLSFLLASSGTALAQEKTPPNPLWYSPGVSRHVEGRGARSSESASPVISSPEVTTAAGTTLATVTSPLVNGNFELGRNVGWSESNAHGADIVTNYNGVSPHSGSWLAYFNYEDSEYSTNSILSQSNIAVVAPTTMRFWYWSASNDDCGYDYAYVKVNSDIIYYWSVCYDNNTYGWVPIDLNLNAYSGQTVTLSIQLITDPEGWWSAMIVDDVSLYGTFADVPYDHIFVRQIEAFYNAGLTTGCSPAGVTPKLYCPYNNVTRAEMAVFLERAIGNFTPNPSPTGMFADVPGTFWASKFIDQFYNDSLTTGCTPASVTPKLYCPDNNVTRAEMAVFVERATGNFTPTPSPSGMFADVLPDHWAAKFIDQFYNDGITTGCAQSPLRYCPNNNVTRQEMAVFIVRAFHIPLP